MLSAADEIAVEAFRKRRIGFLDIVEVIESTLAIHDGVDVSHLDVVKEVDEWARKTATRLIQGRQP